MEGQSAELVFLQQTPPLLDGIELYLLTAVLCLKASGIEIAHTVQTLGDVGRFISTGRWFSVH